MAGAAGIVGGVLGLALGLAIAPKKKAACAPAPALPTASKCGPTEIDRWAVQKGITGLVVSNTSDVESVPAPDHGIAFVVDQSTCTVYKWAPDPLASAYGWYHWAADDVLTSDLQTFVGLKEAVPPPDLPSEAQAAAWAHQLPPSVEYWALGKFWFFVTDGPQPNENAFDLKPAPSGAFYGTSANATYFWLYYLENSAAPGSPNARQGVATLYVWSFDHRPGVPEGTMAWLPLRSLRWGSQVGW